MKAQCTPSDYRRISRWEHEVVLEAVQRRLDKQPQAMTLRRRTVEHVFGTLKHWMGCGNPTDTISSNGEYVVVKQGDARGTSRRTA
jgi:hypothetical protein